MRFIDFHQWESVYASFGQYRPQKIPDPSQTECYSDEQAYAIALYVYSLKPPENPNQPSAATKRGARLFNEEGCMKCHDPEQKYSNRMLTLAKGFDLPKDHPESANVMTRSVGTDPTYALETRKGTGLYKVPSLLALWLRGPIQHNGSCLTLEDWFDSKRLDDDYVPTEWRGFAGDLRGVQGHKFGLDLDESDKRDLIAFLRSL